MIEREFDDDGLDLVRVNENPFDAPDADAVILHLRTDVEPGDGDVFVADEVGVSLFEQPSSGHDHQQGDQQPAGDQQEEAEARFLRACYFTQGGLDLRLEID